MDLINEHGEPISEITENFSDSKSNDISQNNHSTPVTSDSIAISTNLRRGQEPSLSSGEPFTSTTVRKHNLLNFVHNGWITLEAWTLNLNTNILQAKKNIYI